MANRAHLQAKLGPRQGEKIVKNNSTVLFILAASILSGCAGHSNTRKVNLPDGSTIDAQAVRTPNGSTVVNETVDMKSYAPLYYGLGYGGLGYGYNPYGYGTATAPVFQGHVLTVTDAQRQVESIQGGPAVMVPSYQVVQGGAAPAACPTGKCLTDAHGRAFYRELKEQKGQINDVKDRVEALENK